VLGRYSLEGSSGARILVLRLQSITPRAFVASAPLAGAIGTRLKATFPNLGLLEGTISRVIEGGFVATIETDAEESRALAARIDWLRRRTYQGVTDKRGHGRFLPRDPRSVVLLADGRVLPCLIINLSASGAAISVDYDPPLSSVLAVGRAIGRVVRKLEAGFAVEFIDPYPVEEVEEVVKPAASWKDAVPSTA
jgi:hypothetical protein